MKALKLNAVNLHKSIDTKAGVITILDGLNLEVEDNQSVAIVGQSGCGKSTLLSLLAGLDLPKRGQIQINGQEITALTEDQRAQFRANRTGFVFQSFYLMDDLTALENIALPMELFGHKNPEKIAKIWLDKLGLNHRANNYPKQLSGGEQQRVALGRAFAMQPEILFADEPTANLDVSTAKEVIEHLFTLHKNSNNSMIIVTHDHKLAQNCDKIYYLKGGKLHESE
jgi:putative ABC transport system ATP-binding protein